MNRILNYIDWMLERHPLLSLLLILLVMGSATNIADFLVPPP